MRKSSKQNEIEKAVKQLELSSEFQTGHLQFEIRTYEKGEHLVSPLSPLQHFVFILSGKVRIYQLDDDSTIHSVLNMESGGILGYNEFCFESADYTLYAEAVANTKCLCLPFHQPAANLRTDADFLLFLLRSSLSAQIRHSEITHLHSELESKVIFYIQNLCTDYTLNSVNDAVATFHCSRRQLQRVLKKLCDDKVLVHPKRGCYKLRSPL